MIGQDEKNRTGTHKNTNRKHLFDCRTLKIPTNPNHKPNQNKTKQKKPTKLLLEPKHSYPRNKALKFNNKKIKKPKIKKLKN
jgi:hypothetical protein